MRGEARLRQDMEDDRRFRLGRLGDESFQWPDRIYQARQQEKRPCLQTNRMPAFVALALNAVIGANLRPSVQPVDDKADVKTAEVLSALIRNTEHISQVEAVYAAAIDSMAENGRGYVQINMNILKSLMRSPLGLDLYLWLTYRPSTSRARSVSRGGSSTGSSARTQRLVMGSPRTARPPGRDGCSSPRARSVTDTASPRADTTDYTWHKTLAELLAQA